MCGLFGSVDNARFSVTGDVLAISFRDWKVEVGLIAVTKEAMLVQCSLYRAVLSSSVIFQLQCVLTVHVSHLKKELQGKRLEAQTKQRRTIDDPSETTCL